MPPKRAADKKTTSTEKPAANNQITESTTNVGQNSHPSQTADQDATTASLSRSGSTLSVRRLDTLQSPVPPSSSSSSTVQGRGSSTRARPRGIGRRSQHGRAELEKAELERKQAEAVRKPQSKPWQNRKDNVRGRGAMRGRMRGGYVGENERRADGIPQASGPFSLGQVTKDAGRPAYGGSGRGGGLGGGSGGGGSGSQRMTGGTTASASGSRIKQEHRSNGDAVMTDIHIKQEDGGYISSDADDERLGPRKLDIDSLVDLTRGADDGYDDDIVYLPPVRIQRVEHKERTLVAHTESASRPDGTVAVAQGNDVAAIERRRGKQRTKDDVAQRETQRYKGTYTDSESEDDVQVKQEHHDDSHAQDDGQSPPTSPDARRRLKVGIRTDSISDEHRPSFQTKEEELEWEVRQRDLRILRAELGQLSLPPAVSSDAETVPDASAGEDPRADKMYLFQFPAILPTLVPVNPKQEDGDINMQDVPEAGTSTKPATNMKTDTKTYSTKPAAEIPSGMVGKLRVHKSGRAFLDWGGIPMEVSMGQEASFLQDVVIVDCKDTKPGAETDAEQDQSGGTAMSMGQVKGRFVVVPQWDAIFDQVY